MQKTIISTVIILTLALAGSAAPALVPGVYDPGSTGCPSATYSNGVLHLAKNCATGTNAAAGADITGLTGQAFTTAAFTLGSAAQCQGGSPRFDIVTTTGTFFLGCNNVAPTTNGDGTLTYTFDAASIAAGGLPFPPGTITSADVLLDVQGTADVSKIFVNGTAEVPVPATTGGTPTTKASCKHAGWKTFTQPSFKNQGQCVSYVDHHAKHGKSTKHSGLSTAPAPAKTKHVKK
ncbi:MAG: hypothetical protein H0X39_01630 [Actinobacteria bacterium]|nr:hypothetical protein [Actinomycetota bacterium]